jgi:transposase
MTRTGRPKAELMLYDDESAALYRWAHRAKSSQILALRARIILSCAEGRDNKETAALLRCHEDTVGKWRRRFIERRLDGLSDEPRPGRVPAITDEQVEKIVADTLEQMEQESRPFIWTKSAEEILESIGRLLGELKTRHTSTAVANC